jgi:TolA-binding protein
MNLTRRSSAGLLRGALISVIFVTGMAFAQDYGSMGITEVIGTADRFLQLEQFNRAIPALKEVVKRTEGNPDPKIHETLQTCRFQLGRSYYQVGNNKAGQAVLEAYINDEPRPKENVALRLMAQGFFETEEWERIETVASRMLGLPELSDDDRFNGNLLLGQALFRLKQWEDSVAPLTYASENAKDERTRSLTQIMVVRALVESESWDELFVWIPKLYRTDAKYDITLNLTLMKAGKARFEREDYLNALQLYRMVFPREELYAFANQRIRQMSAKLAADVKIGIRKSDEERRQKEIDEIKESIKVLDDLPAYEDEVTFRIGQIYKDVKRFWEAYVLFDKLYEQDHNSDIGEAAALQSVLILHDDVREIDRAEKRILTYLDEKPDGQYARTMLSIMLRRNLVEQNIEKVVSLAEYVNNMPPTDDMDEILLQADLHYMLAFGYFQNKDFALASGQFGAILNPRYKNSQHYDDALFYRGMAEMLQAKYDSAMEDFVAYRDKYPEGDHYAPALFRVGVCYFGQTDTKNSEAIFTEFIETFPTNSLVSEAYSMRGDIEAAKDGSDDPATPDIDEYDPHTLDRALADYRKAIDAATSELQAAYPAFQAAKVFKMEFKWQEIIDLMNYYMNKWGEKADVAQAVYWIGQSQIELGKIDDAITSYLDAIDRFGNDIEQEGVDKIIDELVTIANDYLEEEALNALVTKIKLKLTSLDDRLDVLKLRLRVLMAQLEGDEAALALGAELLSSGQDLKITTPVSLALMCDAAVEAGDVEKMGELYQYFTANFEEADQLWKAYRALVHKQLAENDIQGVMATIDEVQGLFGAESYMGWAQMTKARTLLEQGKYEEAEAAYNMIMGVGEWRGPLFAEAMYGMGQCRLALQDLNAAHSFFQRIYLLFKGYDNGKWAAMGSLQAADTLVKLGREEDALNTWNAMLEDSYVNTLPQAKEAEKMLKKYGGAL